MRNLRALGLAGRPRVRARVLRNHPRPGPRRRTAVRRKPPGRDDGIRASGGAATGQHRCTGIWRRPSSGESALRQHGSLNPDADRVFPQCRIRSGRGRTGPTRPQRLTAVRAGRVAGHSPPDPRKQVGSRRTVRRDAAAPRNFAPRPADSEARGQARWVGVIVWLGDLACALAVARCAALLGFLGSQVRDERRWLSLARWAAQHPGTGRLGYVEPGHRERWLLIE